MSDAASENLEEKWRAAWPAALAAWSRYTQVRDPIFCRSKRQEAAEGLTGSFAMIRLVDQTVVISLRQVADLGLGDFATEILAHEIGHHVYCPADLTDNARLLARVRAGLPGKEILAPMVANLYADLLLNDRLHRQAGLDIAGVYRRIAGDAPSAWWCVYLRTYEWLWNVTLLAANENDSPRLANDARLAGRLVRSYSRDWLAGAGRFACLMFPHLPEPAEPMALQWHDTRGAGAGGLPEGMAEVDPEEEAGAVHPAEDEVDDAGNARPAKAGVTGRKTHKAAPRSPVAYRELLRAAGSTETDKALTARYYAELARPHLIPFPSRPAPKSLDPLPGALERWDVGEATEDIDWLGSVVASPRVVPGVTTRQRPPDFAPGAESRPRPIDLYLGVDCSGSMGDPASFTSYTILAGAVVALSCLRAGGRVMVVLSGEPGRTLATDGFVRDKAAVLETLTDYLGTGYTFGVHRLADTFGDKAGREANAHVLLLTDNDLFMMLEQDGVDRQQKQSGRGWKVAGETVARCGAGGTIVFELPRYLMNQKRAAAVVHPGRARLETQGWATAEVGGEDELIAFARRFARMKFGGRR